MEHNPPYLRLDSLASSLKKAGNRGRCACLFPLSCLFQDAAVHHGERRAGFAYMVEFSVLIASLVTRIQTRRSSRGIGKTKSPCYGAVHLAAATCVQARNRRSRNFLFI
jgi:hypothetical protein